MRKTASLFIFDREIKIRLSRHFNINDAPTIDFVIREIMHDLSDNIMTFTPILHTFNEEDLFIFGSVIKRSKIILSRIKKRLIKIEKKTPKIYEAISNIESLIKF